MGVLKGFRWAIEHEILPTHLKSHPLSSRPPLPSPESGWSCSSTGTQTCIRESLVTRAIRKKATNVYGEALATTMPTQKTSWPPWKYLLSNTERERISKLTTKIDQHVGKWLKSQNPRILVSKNGLLIMPPSHRLAVMMKCHGVHTLPGLLSEMALKRNLERNLAHRKQYSKHIAYIANSLQQQ